MKLGNKEVGRVFLAPMAGVTDKVFRAICTQMGADLTYTEMISAKGLLYGSKNTEKLLQTDYPCVVQLFGSDPQILSEMMKRLENERVIAFDINMGCPAPKIVKNGEGSALMDKPVLAGKIVEACAKGVQTPVTVKIRKGFSAPNCEEIAYIAQESGAAAVAVHGRMREEFYSGKADIEIISRVRGRLSIPVIASGDITDGKSAKEVFEKTGCAAVMIGRAACGNPFVFREIKCFLKNGTSLPKPANEEKFNTAAEHIKRLVEFKGEYTGIREMRTHLGRYIKGISGVAAARREINKAETAQELMNIIERIFRE